MKNIVLGIVFLTSMASFAQSSGFGVKGGLNYGSTGDIDLIGQEVESDNKVGYHVGVFGHVPLGFLFIQPEVVYTDLNSSYNEGDFEGTYNLQKIDVPILVGLDILGPINIKAGPAFQYILDGELEDFNNIEVGDAEEDISIGYQLGVGLQLGKLGLDLRYESAFKENDAVSDLLIDDVSNSRLTIDTRPSQFILSLSYLF